MKWTDCLRIHVVVLLLSLPAVITAQPDSLKLQGRDASLQQTIPDADILKGADQSVHLDSILHALQILKQYQSDEANWEDSDDPLRLAIQSLILHVEIKPLDSTILFLNDYSYSKVKIKKLPFTVPDSNNIRISDSLLMADSTMAGDSLMAAEPDSLIKLESLGMTTPGDSLVLEIVRTRLKEPPEDSLMRASHDSLAMLRPDSLDDYIAGKDSVHKAIMDLIYFLESRPATSWLYNVAGDSTKVTTSGDEPVIKRFWLKNNALDSVGIWVEPIGNGKFRFIVDDGIRFQRMTPGKYRRKYQFARQDVDAGLKEVQLIDIKKNPWNIGGIGELLLSQVYLSNWAKGGENSLSALFKTNLDAIYTMNKVKWENVFRARYGIVNLRNEGVRKSEDQWEINTSVGFKASKLWFYSFAFNLKSQFAPGYKYPNDSVIGSNFLSPGYLYSSAGFEYNPDKQTQILASPLTFRSTFVIDTVNIEHTKFGIFKDRKALNEIGIFVKASHLYKFTEDLSLENRLQFFTDYLGFKKVDFDWESNFRAKFGPFFTVNINIHFIYNSDVTFPVLDDTGAVTGRKPKLQFKEWVGLGLSYKF